MKKIVNSSFVMLMALSSLQLLGKTVEKYDSCFDGAVSAGFVFKHECTFEEVYGKGIINAITGDLVYFPWKRWGVGGKLSYWRRKGSTSFLKLCSIIQQVPFTICVRRRKEFNSGLQLYASLGGGIIWSKEKSYLGETSFTKGVGEAEVGLRYPLWHGIGLTGAFRALFPSQCYASETVRVGGFDLRAGIGFSF